MKLFYVYVLISAIGPVWGTGGTGEPVNPLTAGSARSTLDKETQTSEIPPAVMPEIENIDTWINECVEKFSHSRRNLLLRDIFRATVLFVSITTFTLIIATNTNDTTISRSGTIIQPCDNISNYTQDHPAIHDLSSISNTSIIRNNETLWMCSWQILKESTNTLKTALYALGATANIFAILYQVIFGRQFQAKSFKDMVTEAYNKRNKKFIEEREIKQFLVFAEGKYNGSFNASGPFNNAGFEADLVGWKAS